VSYVFRQPPQLFRRQPIEEEVGSRTELGDAARLRRLRECGLSAGSRSESLDRLVRAAAHQLRAVRAQVSLIGPESRAVAGQAGPSVAHSFCRIVVDTDAPLLVSDSRTDDRLSCHPAIADGMIAYAGFPLRSADGYPLGAFFVAHDQPRDWEPRELLLVEDLAAAASSELALRAEVHRLRHQQPDSGTRREAPPRPAS
jgi:GAF domain-containing protein